MSGNRRLDSNRTGIYTAFGNIENKYGNTILGDRNMCSNNGNSRDIFVVMNVRKLRGKEEVNV